MGPRGQPKGQELTAFGIRSRQQGGVVADGVSVVANGALLTMQGRGMRDGDVVVIERVVMGDLPIAMQAEFTAPQKLSGLLQAVSGLIEQEIQLCRQRQRIVAQSHPDQANALLTTEHRQGPIVPIEG